MKAISETKYTTANYFCHAKGKKVKKDMTVWRKRSRKDFPWTLQNREIF